MKRKIFVLLITVLFVLVISACNEKDSKEDVSADVESTEVTETDSDIYTLVFGHVQAEDHAYHLMAEKFKEEVEELSQGQIQVDIYPAGQLGNESELIEGLQMDSVDITTVTSAISSNFVEDFGVFSLPFLFNDFTHMFKVMDSEIGDELANTLEEKGFIKLGFVSGGTRSLYSNEPIESLADLQSKKIRVIEDDIYIDTWNNLGALATPIAWDDVYLSLEQGVVDGAEGALISYQSMGFYDPSPYVTVIDYIFSWHNFIMSKSSLESLPEELQEHVLEAAKRAEAFERKYVQQLEEELIDTLIEEHDVTVFYPEDLDDWKKAVSSLYDEFGDDELIDQIRDIE